MKKVTLQSRISIVIVGLVLLAIASGSAWAQTGGTVVAWGVNDYGQTTVPAGLSGVTAIAAGIYHSLALKSDGTVVAWGLNNYGQSTVPAGLSGVTAIAAGVSITAAGADSALRPRLPGACGAGDQAVSTNENTPVTITLVATDQDDDDLSFLLTTPPAHGILTGSSLGSFTYTPVSNFSGSDDFTFQAYDGLALSNAATVNITVITYNHPPVAQPDSATTTRGTKVAIDVLANDSDPDGDALAVVSFTKGANGKVTTGTSSKLSYSPAAGFMGTDTFGYTISDGRGGMATAAVSVTVIK
jgi:hypothetical protein